MKLDDIDPDAPVGAIIEIDDSTPGQVAIHTQQGWVLTPDACPHEECPWSEDGEIVDDGTLVCNCHGSEYDPYTGELKLGPATENIVVTRLDVVDGKLAQPE